MKIYKGQCSCGQLQFQFEDEPFHSAFCYCRSCQIHTGSDKWFGLWVPTGKFKFITGKASCFTRKGDSGKDLNSLFCPDCGTTLCAEVTLGNFYSVSASSLTEPHNLTPQMLIYTESAPNWAVFPDNVPKYDTLPKNVADIIAKGMA